MGTSLGSGNPERALDDGKSRVDGVAFKLNRTQARSRVWQSQGWGEGNKTGRSIGTGKVVSQLKTRTRKWRRYRGETFKWQEHSGWKLTRKFGELEHKLLENVDRKASMATGCQEGLDVGQSRRQAQRR